MQALKGSFQALMFYDVADEIRLDEVRRTLAELHPERRPEFRGSMPAYLGPERPPVAHQAGAVEVAGVAWSCVVKLYDHGVLSVALERPFESGWEELQALCSHRIGAPEIEATALRVAKEQMRRIERALHRPYGEWISEDYHIVHVHSGGSATARETIAANGGHIARIVRGEPAALSESETGEILKDSMSYYPTDLLVVGWAAAFVCDTPEGAAPTTQLLEYANAQLVEFRHYDNLMTRLLSIAHDELERRRAPWLRWKAGRDAQRLNRTRLEVIELTERLDNSIKFLSDMFYARVYRMAAQRIGVTDYRELVDQKLEIAGELYRHMAEESHQARAFMLEFMVVVILVIELGLFLAGKR